MEKKLGKQPSYQEYPLESKPQILTTDEPSKTGCDCDFCIKQIKSQSRLINSLKTRIEELEHGSTVKNREIQKLQQDVHYLILRSDRELMYNNIVYDDVSDYKDMIWMGGMDESSYLRYTIDNENLAGDLGPSEAAYIEPTNGSSSTSSQFNQGGQSKVELIHARILHLIKQRAKSGYKLRLKNLKTFRNAFTSDDWVQYTRTDYFSSLHENFQKLINLLVQEMLSNELAQERLARGPGQDDETSDPPLTLPTVNVDGIEGSTSQELQHNTTLKLQKLHFQVQHIVRGGAGRQLRYRNFKHLKDFYTVQDFIQYANTHDFDQLDKDTKRHITFIIRQMTDTLRSPPELPLTNPFQGTTPEVQQLHFQVQQITVREESRGHRVRWKHYRHLTQSYTINDFVQYVNASDFRSLNARPKRAIDTLVRKFLTDGFKKNPAIFLQNSEEYIKRDIVPALPSDCKNYIEFDESIVLENHFLSSKKKERVKKLAELEKSMPQEPMNVDEKVKTEEGL